MPKLQDYACRACEHIFEFFHVGREIAACPQCGSTACDLRLGGHAFTTIVPTYPGAKRRKAGYVHEHVNRPAEKVSVSVPNRQGDP